MSKRQIKGFEQVQRSASRHPSSAANSTEQARQRLTAANFAAKQQAKTATDASSHAPAAKERAAKLAEALKKMDLLNRILLSGTHEQESLERIRESLKAFDQYQSGEKYPIY